MIWINIFFFTVIMNTITGTVAYLLCKLLIRIAEMAGAVRVIYPLYRLVLLFYVVPVGWLYIHAKFYFAYGTTVIGDAFYGKPILSKIVFAALVIWIIGLIGLLIHTVKEEWEKWQAHRRKMKNNLPMRAEEYHNMLKRMYPHHNWNRIEFYTNFTAKTPVVAGAFAQKIILPEREFTEKQMQVILMHEGMHIVRLDNLAKRISSVITYINWFNPLLGPYIKELDQWGDISCDINVCK